MNDPAKQQLGILNEESLDAYCENHGIEEAVRKEMNQLGERNKMTDIEAHQKLADLFPPVEILLDCWNNSSMKSVTLTSVGIAIAHANIESKTDKEIDLGIWIK